MVCGWTMLTTAFALSTAQNAITDSTVLSPNTTTPVPGLHAAAFQGIRQSIGPGLEVGVGQALAVAYQRDLVREALRGVNEIVVKQRNR